MASTANAFSFPTKAKSSTTLFQSSRKQFLEKSVGITAFGLVSTLPLTTSASYAEDESDFITTESGLKYLVTKEGTGAIPETGANVKAHYTGWLDGFDSIRKFDS